MGEFSMSKEADHLPPQDQNKDASESLRLSLTKSDLLSSSAKTNSQRTLESIAETKAGRYALVTAEGISLLPSGVLNGIKHNYDNPGEFGLKMGMAAAIGTGMRLLLPQAGAARAAAGTIMTYLMVKDAATPVLNAYSQVSENKSLANVHDAARNMSNGLGLFGVDMVAGLPVGLAAEKLTGVALQRTATGRSFEAWKSDFYNNKLGGWLGKNAAADAANLSGESMEARLKAIQEGTGNKPLTIDQKMKLIQENLDHQHAAPTKLTPAAEAAFKAYLEHKKWHKQEMPKQIDELLGDAGLAADGLLAKGGRDNGLKPARLLDAEGKPGAEAKPGSDHPGVKLEQPAPAPKALDKDAATVAQMAVTMRDRAAQVTETDMKIANFKESVQSPLEQTMRTGKPPLDEGHWANNRALVELTSEIKTGDHIQQAGFLLEHHRVANVQMGIPKVLPEIVDLNQYSRSVHKKLMDLLTANGIKPETVLRGTNSPVFLIFDSSGSGPYTIPAIKGVTDTAVIVLPREYQNMLGVHVSGVYPHEMGHDLIYGDLLRFPESLRENVLKQDVIAAAMAKKGIADTNVEVPGAGTFKKSDFFTKLLLAQANENTADIFGTAIDPNSGLSLATLLSSLRKPAANAPKGAPGQLETRSMYGQQFVDPVSNPLGIEVHGIDSWRIKLSAEVLRQLSKNDAKVTKYADNLDKLSDSLRRPGDNYVWASVDQPGKFVSVAMKEWDAIIPEIVRAQLETPLPALNNKALRDVYPDMSKIFPRVDALADKISAAARNGETSIKDFKKAEHAIEDIYSAGLAGWWKALNQNPELGKPGFVPPEVLLERINGLSQTMTSQYRGDNYLPATPQQLAPPSGFDFSSLVVKPAGYVGKTFGNAAESRPWLKSTFNNWTTKSSVGASLALTRDMLDTEQRMADLLRQQSKGN